MKKNIFFIIIFIVLNGCAQYSSIVGPAYTMAKTGSPILAGASAATSYGIKKTTGYTPGEHINSPVKTNSSLKEEDVNGYPTKEFSTPFARVISISLRRTLV